jgi:hypothetical protein
MTDVYWNLHRDCFSVRAPGRPVTHVDRIALRNCRFVVQRAGWQRTIRERRKRVHAMVRGEPIEAAMVEAAEGQSRKRPHGTVRVTYDPYVAPYFRDRITNERIDTARIVWFSIEDGKPVVEVLE